ncbi:unnamed protein product [Darwinula stevensoni]|uniref:Gustatory receptor n=1 Tax=Darwinula stevensoni TaxID=69355 RepID=A0A7R9A0A0_9CRUS|nr:unnamed protein product [Darwinula stevensoni]CAG0885184.1 unnamed protein product [Darwinula stevensoni]
MAGESVLAWLRPFLLIAKTLGLFPVKNVHRVGYEGKGALKFRALSATTVYSVLFLPSMMGCTFAMIMKSNYLDLSSTVADDIATKCMVGIMIASFAVSYLGMWINVSRYPAFLKRVRRMEEEIDLNDKESRPLKRVGGFMLSSYMVIFLNIALACSLNSIFHDNSVKETVLYVIGTFFLYVLFVASLTPELIFVYLCHVLRIFSVHVLEDLSRKLKSHVAAKRDVPASTLTLPQKKFPAIIVPDTDSEIQICVQKARALFLEISSLADSLSGLHSPGLLLIFLCNSVMATIMIYQGASAILREDWVICLSGFGSGILSLFRMGHVALAAGNIGTQTQAKLKEITASSTQLSDRLSQQMILFELQMSSHPVQLTASDYFTLGKGIMTSRATALSKTDPSQKMAGESVLAWLRPFLFIAKILGLFPLENVRSVGHESKDALQFRALSAATVYSVLFLPCMMGCTFAMLFISNSFDQTSTVADDIATKCTVVMAIAFFILSYLGMWINASRYPAFLERVRRMEMRIGLGAEEGRSLKRVGSYMLSFHVVFFLIVAMTVTFHIISYDNSVMKDIMHIVGSFLFYVLLVASLTPELIFVYLCHVLRIYTIHVLEDLSKKLKLHLVAKRDVPVLTLPVPQKQISTTIIPDPDSEIQSSVQEARALFLEISSLADSLSRLYSPGLLLIFLCNSVIATVTLYHGASAILRKDWVVCLNGFGSGFVSLFRMGHVAVAAGNIGTETQAKLKEISTINSAQSPGRPSPEMILFELEVSSHPVKLTASDYFTLDKGIMTSVFGTIVTYLVVLLQFRIQEVMDVDPAMTLSNSSSLASVSSNVP